MATPARSHADACPGVFAPHDAADGAVARIRLPGGVLTAAQLRVLAGCAADLGDGTAHLTSRGNVQLRGLDRAEPELVRRLSAAGLLPAPGHERVRNILGSPASGLDGGEAAGLLDVRPLVRQLDAALCARPELARLPGRFLFALDDGRGDVAGEDPDVAWQAVTGREFADPNDAGFDRRNSTGPDGSGPEGALLLAGADTGLRVPAAAAVDALLGVAAAFTATRGAAWRVRELPDTGALLVAAAPLGRRAEPARLPRRAGPPVGVHPGFACVAPVLGELAATTLRGLADRSSAGVVVTPWRTLLLPGVTTPPDLPGLVTDPADPAPGVSACVGRPGCPKSRADVRADARRLLPVLPPGHRVHLAGCERRCGRPRGPHVDVLAADGGYRVGGSWVPAARVAEAAQRAGEDG
ncbi:precorrin-3B synthase [Amycolatopsis arida]|uniref:Precorrin-3B synthase n=1 Tax=Amycolatopsis arida TaxID=587909 RepID=A0A1I5LN03_9PSEU|nr:nitrite/sulfite reductase [Amycolatopsis arida]TDX93775.1 precorrin-3B synthase [Amycolatopsis arida]SFO98547.1 precorrin-3B synthase [Amycolatopsis arida]